MTLLSSEKIKAEALRIGFSACGLAPADTVDKDIAQCFRQWLSDGYHGSMEYMNNHLEKRLDPRQLVDGAQTIVSVALNYFPAEKLPENEYQIAWYAYGKDYHTIVKAKLAELFRFIQSGYAVSGRTFCDTAPVLERYWAWRAGLGWIGKNTQLIIPHAGSCFFLGELILDMKADQYDIPQENRCGTCTRCLDACPSKALEAYPSIALETCPSEVLEAYPSKIPEACSSKALEACSSEALKAKTLEAYSSKAPGTSFRLNSSKCQSYLTIEHRGDFPPKMSLKTHDYIYGCDECQRVCPWNRFATPCKTLELQPSPALLQMKKEDWHELTEEKYQTLFKDSAVKRTKYQGLIRNIKAMTGKGKEGQSENDVDAK